jgi:signal transduction histidine kinase
MRGQFLWRMAGVLLFLLLAAGAVCAATLWLLGLIRTPGAGMQVLPWLLLGLGLFILAASLPGLRGLALPLRDLIEAAGRVEGGDLSPHVAERGPRELRALARAFNAMIARLKTTEGIRRRLLADVTHELRTPVAVIQGNLEAMLDGVYPADAAHIQPVLEETRVLSRLIDDLRTLSLAESGALELHREATDLGMLAGDVAASFRAQADGAGITLRVDAPSDIPLAEIDPVRIREVLVNLCANALRHTSSGGSVTIQVEVDEQRRRALVSVVDTGTGISPEDLPHVFDRFFKSRDSAGSGLGLAIAKNLVSAHGGQIEAQSQVGSGTTVRFTLPLDAVDHRSGSL